MEDLKYLLDNLQIAEIEDNVKSFVHSADGYDNHLKLVFSLLALLRESAALLQTVDSETFISDITKSITEMSEQTDGLKQSYHDHIVQNQEIYELLSDGTNERMTDLRNNIDSLLAEFDGIIKALVEAREELPIEKQLAETK